MKQLKLPTQKYKGMVVYCSKCRKHFSWTKKQEEQKVLEPVCGQSKGRLSSCKFKDKQSYKVKVHIPGTRKGEVSKVLQSKRYDEAIIEAVEFRAEFKRTLHGHNPNPIHPKKATRTYLFDAQIRYIDFLADIDVPEHQKRNRSEDYIKQLLKSLEYFNDCLKENDINKRLLPIDRVDDSHVGYFHANLNARGFKSRTYNKHMGNLKIFYKWAIQNYNLKIGSNPFDKVKNKPTVYKKETITGDEFRKLLVQITPENGKFERKTKNGTKKMNYFCSYLKDALELALHTGGRREEIAILRWDMIKEIDGKPTYIEVRNLKVERITKREGQDSIAPKIVPITSGLMEVLLRMGYQEKKGSTDFIICPDRKRTSIGAIKNRMTDGFSFFYNQLNTDRSLQFKCLRKTYLTYLDLAMKGDSKLLSSHSNDEVLQKHYIDQKIVAKAVKELHIFE